MNYIRMMSIKEAEALSRYSDTIKRELARRGRSNQIGVNDGEYGFAIQRAKDNLASDENRNFLSKLIDEYEATLLNEERERLQKDEDAKRKIEEDLASALQKISEDAANAIAELRKCPRCGSNNVHVGPKGFSAGKAIVGAVAFGVVGLAAGAIGSNKIQYTCLSCGKQWR